MIFANLNAYYILLYHIWFKFIDALEASMVHNGIDKNNLFRAYTIFPSNTPEYFAEGCSLSTKSNPTDTKYTIHKYYKRQQDNGFLYPVLSITLDMINVEADEITPTGHPIITYYIVRDDNTCKVDIKTSCMCYGNMNDTDRQIYDWHVTMFDSIMEEIQADIESGEEAGLEYLMDHYDDERGKHND